MPTEDFNKGKLYYKSKDDKEYKKIGTGTLESSSIEEKENDNFKKMEELYYEKGFTAEIDVEIKKYRKKRFKKLLMSQGIQRNDAEIFASIAGEEESPIKRDDFGLIIAKSIALSFEINKEREEK